MSIEQKPKNNEILFVWFNNYSGIILKTPLRTLLIDPVDVKPRNLLDVDAILVTHEHYDHLDYRLVQNVQKLTNCMVVADPTSAARLRCNIPPEKVQEVDPGLEVKIGEVSIKAEKCNHQPSATPVTLIITSEDGVKIFHTADSLPFPEMAEIGEREKFDVVFCTVGIAPGASPETGLEIARLTKPKVAIPYHTNNAADQKKFAESLNREMPRTKCLIPEQGKIYQVSRRS